MVRLRNIGCWSRRGIGCWAWGMIGFNFGGWWSVGCRSRAIKNGTSKLGFASDKGEEGEDCKYLKKILNHFLAHNTNTILKKVFQFRIDLITFFKITL